MGFAVVSDAKRDHNRNGSTEAAAEQLIKTKTNNTPNGAGIRKQLVGTSQAQQSPLLVQYVTWMWRLLKRKQSLVVCALMVVLLLLVSVMRIDSLSGINDVAGVVGTSGEDDEAAAAAARERIALMHRSHMPGMKDVSGELGQQHLDSSTSETKSHSSPILINNATALPPSASKTPAGYLVWSDQCKMPNTDPYEMEVMKLFKRQKYKPCSSQPALTSVSWNIALGRFVLHLHGERVGSYEKLMKKADWSDSSGSKDYHCCYQAVERNATGSQADFLVALSNCEHFPVGDTTLSPELDSILVHCYPGKSTGSVQSSTALPNHGKQKKAFYSNGHPLLPMRPELKERIASWKVQSASTDKASAPMSVLMIGIDSISRVNLIRAMPRTAQYLYENEWFEMSGYNKVDDNTFPNLMAVLAGMNKSSAHRLCPPTKQHALDNCDFIWKNYRERGYVTAYAEDAASINTFNYLKAGFEQIPVDYYMRPFLIAAEHHLPTTHRSSMIDCIGPQHSAEAVYDYALQLARRHKHDPFFGLFWTNSFSHNAISDCSALDARMVEYFKTFGTLGVLENTFVVFFSDHGLRFGPTRKLQSSHFEERLPFLFFWLPPRIRIAHPEFVNALIVNRNRLTNPYDLHMTLRHVLSLASPSPDQIMQPLPDCPLCQSMLKPVPQNRSCADIAIEDHWCTCMPFQNLYKNSKTVRRVAKLTVSYLNDFVTHYNNGTLTKLCVPLKLSSVEHAYRAEHTGTSTNSKSSAENVVSTYRITFYTKPNQGLFEATVRYNPHSDALQVTGEVSRLNSYSSDSACTQDGAAKKYCSCVKKII